MYDITIIGAGVIGCSIARALSRYELNILVLEKENDVSCGASKANSGIVHGGYDAKHGSLKGYFSRKGNRLFKALNEELNFGYEECGSLVLAFSEAEMKGLDKLIENGEKNGVDDLSILPKEEILKMEANVNTTVLGGLYCPTAGITSPYELTIALAENAVANGVTLKLCHELINISKEARVFELKALNTLNGSGKQEESFKSKMVINCAGVYADKIAGMVGLNDFSIIPRRGEYILMHKNQGQLVNRVLFQAPTEKGKGILVTKTVFGNLMIGPNAEEVDEGTEIGTSIEALKDIVKKARKTTDAFDLKFTLKTFAGIRATSSKKDFIIEHSSVDKFINVAGIESPGLTSSPAIALHVVGLVKERLGSLVEKRDYNPYRKSVYEKNDKTADKVCRCEDIRKPVIIEALSRGIPIHSTDAIKRRTRAGMGPCQGTYCGPIVRQIIGDYNKESVDNISERGQGSSSLPYREKRDFWKLLEDQ
jgi:glycerol-3-phosphate dehydrogenase